MQKLAERVGFVRLRQGFGGISSCQRRHPTEARAETRRERRRMAERVGFEPTVEFPLHTLSKRARSTTPTSLRLESTVCEQSRADYRRNVLQILPFPQRVLYSAVCEARAEGSEWKLCNTSQCGEITYAESLSCSAGVARVQSLRAPRLSVNSATGAAPAYASRVPNRK